MKYFFTLSLLFLLAGCTSYVELFKTHPTFPAKVNDYTCVFENDTVKIEYNLWGEHGVLDFTVYNKMDIPIYIDWKKSSFIRNNIKLDYYIDEEAINTTTDYKTYLYNKWYGFATGAKANSHSVVSKPERITFIAPRSTYERNQFILLPLSGIGFKGTVKDVNKTTDSLKKTTIVVKKYTKEETILTFRNFLTFSTSEKFEKEFYVDNGFYISIATLMDLNQFQGHYGIVKANGNNTWEYDYPYQDSRAFYITLDNSTFRQIFP